MPSDGRLLDRIAIGLSSLCLVHCLAMPLLLLALPTASLVFAFPEHFHLAMWVAAIPVSLIALRSGHGHHRHLLPAVAAVVGLCFLGYGAVFIIAERVELSMTVTGAILLAAAHFRNAHLVAEFRQC